MLHNLNGTCEGYTTPDDHLEITWEIPFAWGRPRPATYYDPPEGGSEIDGDPYPSAVVFYPEEGEPLVITNIQEGSILALQIQKKYPLSEDDALAAIDRYIEGATGHRRVEVLTTT